MNLLSVILGQGRDFMKSRPPTRGSRKSSMFLSLLDPRIFEWTVTSPFSSENDILEGGDERSYYQRHLAKEIFRRTD